MENNEMNYEVNEQIPVEEEANDEGSGLSTGGAMLIGGAIAAGLITGGKWVIGKVKNHRAKKALKKAAEAEAQDFEDDVESENTK